MTRPRRLVFRRNGRRVLEHSPFAFCDALNPGPSEEKVAFYERYYEQTRRLQSLLAEGIQASSTDSADQGIENTLKDDAYFWSSTGTPERDSERVEEYLTYKLKHPLCVVHSVQISAYRATYQFGEPVYPPYGVSVYIGDSPDRLIRCTDEPVSMDPNDSAQVVLLPYVTQPIGGYLQIRFHGKQQMQLADGKYYIAVRNICARGLELPFSCLQKLQPALNSARLFHRLTYFSARDVSQVCTLSNGSTILGEIHKKLTSETDKATPVDTTEQQHLVDSPPELSWHTSKGTSYVYDFCECE